MAKSLPYPKVGDHVLVVQKKDYESGVLTEGYVKDILTGQLNHPRGTKVRLLDGTIGRIQAFADKPELGQLQQKESAQITDQTGSDSDKYFEDPEALV